tara:strand:+ start:143 stop:352 length:210 start_codon:yes stop_codon:yes gene_type:complete
MQRIDKECSLSSHDWFFLEVYYHPENTMSLVTLKREMNLPEIMDYKESLEAMKMLRVASEADAKRTQGK